MHTPVCRVRGNKTIWLTRWLLYYSTKAPFYYIIKRFIRCQITNVFFFFKGWILLMTTKLWKPIGSSKLTRHPDWTFLHQLTVQGEVSPHPPSTGRLQLLCQCFFQAMRGSTKQLSNWLVRPAHADTLTPRPQVGHRTGRVCRWWTVVVCEDRGS